MADAILASSGIYVIRNTVNGKIYVGSAINIKHRWYVHASSLRRNKHHSIKLQRAWNAHGESSFEFSVIEYVSRKEDLIAREQYWIDSLQAVDLGYNWCAFAGSNLGYKAPDHVRAKLSARLIGNQYAKGYKHSDATRAKLSAAGTGRRHSEATKRKMSELNKGKTFSIESRAKMSEAKKGKPLSSEHRAKSVAILKNVKRGPMSAETKKKIAEKAKIRSAEQRLASSNRAKAMWEMPGMRARLIASATGKVPYNRKQVVIDGVEYQSMTEAIKALHKDFYWVAAKVKMQEFEIGTES